MWKINFTFTYGSLSPLGSMGMRFLNKLANFSKLINLIPSLYDVDGEDIGINHQLNLRQCFLEFCQDLLIIEASHLNPASPLCVVTPAQVGDTLLDDQ